MIVAVEILGLAFYTSIIYYTASFIVYISFDDIWSETYTNWDQAWPYLSSISFGVSLLNIIDMIFVTVYLLLTTTWQSSEAVNILFAVLMGLMNLPNFAVLVTKVFLIALEAAVPDVPELQLFGLS